jgi:hypothetical protein
MYTDPHQEKWASPVRLALCDSDDVELGVSAAAVEGQTEQADTEQRVGRRFGYGGVLSVNARKLLDAAVCSRRARDDDIQ